VANALYLLALIAILGATDTLYFHEWKARLPARGKEAGKELQLHAARDFVYAVLFATLPWIAWHGLCAGVLALLLLAEITLTMWDFVIEDLIRTPLGGVSPAERVMHGVMGIVYGAMLVFLLPTLAKWWNEKTGLAATDAVVPWQIQWLMAIMAVGVFVSGMRDLLASLGIPGSAWPWDKEPRNGADDRT
jgi:hypothetical protein